MSVKLGDAATTRRQRRPSMQRYFASFSSMCQIPKLLLTLVRPGGTLMAIEGNHGSTFFYPPSRLAWRTIQCLSDLQAARGGDALIGRRLQSLFSGLGVTDLRVDPRAVYADPSRPDWAALFTERTYIAMVEGARALALAGGMMTEAEKRASRICETRNEVASRTRSSRRLPGLVGIRLFWKITSFAAAFRPDVQVLSE